MNKYGLTALDSDETYILPFFYKRRKVNERSLRTMANNLGLAVKKDNDNGIFKITKKEPKK